MLEGKKITLELWKRHKTCAHYFREELPLKKKPESEIVKVLNHSILVGSGGMHPREK